MSNPTHQKYIADTWAKFYEGTLTDVNGETIVDSSEVVQMCDMHRKLLNISTFDAAPVKREPGTITKVMRYSDGTEEVIDVTPPPVISREPAKPRVIGTPVPTVDEYRKLFNAGQLHGAAGSIATDINDLAPNHPLRVDHERKKTLQVAARAALEVADARRVETPGRKRTFVNKRSRVC